MKKKHLIIGLGKTGLSCARYFQKRKIPFILFDTRANLAHAEQVKSEFAYSEIYLGDLPHSCLDYLEEVIVSPGVIHELEVIKHAKALNIPVVGDIELFARVCKAPIVAITGTNGKSTVTELVGEMAYLDNIRVAVGGNLGTPVLELFDDGNDYELWVLELSSFQLETTYNLKLHASCCLNVSADHLDRYKNFEHYVKAKKRIFRHSEVNIYNRDDRLTYPDEKENSISFGVSKPNSNHWGIDTIDNQRCITLGKDCLIGIDEVRIKGVHNWLNAQSASALAHSIGISKDAIIGALRHFKGLSHRCQWLRKISQVDWYDDSKGTNIGATKSAIEGLGAAMQGKIVLIAGGQGKGADFSELVPCVGEYVRTVVLIGEDAPMIEKALCNKIPTVHANSMEDAVIAARQVAQPGDAVLLSPACASFDMFDGFAQRGHVFSDAVHKLQ
jgi:UDP-N-acetylmuramoylalanine--D-glutamate ligase